MPSICRLALYRSDVTHGQSDMWCIFCRDCGFKFFTRAIFFGQLICLFAYLLFPQQCEKVRFGSSSPRDKLAIKEMLSSCGSHNRVASIWRFRCRFLVWQFWDWWLLWTSNMKHCTVFPLHFCVQSETNDNYPGSRGVDNAHKLQFAFLSPSKWKESGYNFFDAHNCDWLVVSTHRVCHTAQLARPGPRVDYNGTRHRIVSAILPVLCKNLQEAETAKSVIGLEVCHWQVTSRYTVSIARVL